jgi:murein DD-endopeptidase MepM/ murein hydrolase activator NlpD
MDLSRVETPVNQRRSITENRDTVLPANRNTQAPDLEVNATIRRPSDSAAEVLKQTLGLVTDAAETVGNVTMKDRADKNSAQGTADAVTGAADAKRLKNSEAYKKAYYTETARGTAFQIDQDATTAVKARLRDEENPADLADIAGIIDQHFKAGALDENGKPKFVDPDAQALAAHQLVATRARLMQGARATIKAREDEKLVSNVAYNITQETIQTRSATPLDVPAPAPEGTPSAPITGLPVPGAITSAFGKRTAPTAGASTDHKGVDIAAPLGTPIAIRAAGTVAATGHDDKRGNWIEVDHGGGVSTRYFHLASAQVKTGDAVDAGAIIGKTGRSGNATGPHLHYTVLQNGKPVDPQKFAFAAAPKGDLGQSIAIDGLRPEAVVAPQAAAPLPPRAPVLAFEDAMQRVPPTVDRATAKKGLMQAFFNAADRANDASLLDGLENSTRKDGSPSFTPQEAGVIFEKRQQIADRVRIEADRTRRETYEKTSDGLYADWLKSGTPPSNSTLTALIDAGKLDPSVAFGIRSHVEAEAKSDEREARAEARQAQALADSETDFRLSALLEARKTGDLSGASYEEDVARFNRGEFGIGKRAVARLNLARSAAREGEQAALKNPDGVFWSTQLQHDLLPPKGKQSLVASALNGGTAGRDRAAGLAALARYRQLIGSGEPPNRAYQAAMAEYDKGPAGAKARADRLIYLRAKAGR